MFFKKEYTPADMDMLINRDNYLVKLEHLKSNLTHCLCMQTDIEVELRIAEMALDPESVDMWQTRLNKIDNYIETLEEEIYKIERRLYI